MKNLSPRLIIDPYLNQSVIYAPNRAKRPRNPKQSKKECPFCPKHEAKTPPTAYQILDLTMKKWQVRVVPNKYPFLTPVSSRLSGKTKICGFHEVIVEVPEHKKKWHSYSNHSLLAVFQAICDRMDHFTRRKKIKSVIFFKNEGTQSGASLPHPHSQIVALPFIPSALKKKITASRKHHRKHGNCWYCQSIKRSQKEKRQVCETQSFVAITPVISNFPYQVQIFPKKHLHDFQSSQASYGDLAKIVKVTIRSMFKKLKDPDYNVLLHTAPNQNAFHWHLEILPRFEGIAGFEIAAGIDINPITPERAAIDLKKQLRKK